MAQRKTVVKPERSRIANAGTKSKDYSEDYQPRTELGRELVAIRKRMVESGEKFLTDAEIAREIAERHGGYYNGKGK